MRVDLINKTLYKTGHGIILLDWINVFSCAMHEKILEETTNRFLALSSFEV